MVEVMGFQCGWVAYQSGLIYFIFILKVQRGQCFRGCSNETLFLKLRQNLRMRPSCRAAKDDSAYRYAAYPLFTSFLFTQILRTLSTRSINLGGRVKLRVANQKALTVSSI